MKGTRNPQYKQIPYRLFEALAASSPRAELREYAQSYEGRPLVYLAISDEDVDV